MTATDRGGCLDGLDCSFKYFLGQAQVGGATVHDALVIVVLRTEGEEVGRVNLTAEHPTGAAVLASHFVCVPPWASCLTSVYLFSCSELKII